MTGPRDVAAVPMLHGTVKFGDPDWRPVGYWSINASRRLQAQTSDVSKLAESADCLQDSPRLLTLGAIIVWGPIVGDSTGAVISSCAEMGYNIGVLDVCIRGGEFC